MSEWRTQAVCIATLLVTGVLLPVSAAGQPSSAASPLAITPNKLEFAAQAVGAQSPAQSITLKNSGGAELQISSILTSGIDFAQSNNCGASLAAGASCKIAVTFKPATSGPRIGTLNLFDSAPDAPQMITLSGAGE